MPIISALERLRQKDLESKKDLSFRARPCLKRRKQLGGGEKERREERKKGVGRGEEEMLY
jgi:hypothetical protein